MTHPVQPFVLPSAPGVRLAPPRTITAPIAWMHPGDQDVIDGFLEALALSGFALKGQFLQRLVDLGVARCDNSNSQEATQLLPDELLKLARAWKKEPEKVIASLEGRTHRSGHRLPRTLERVL